MCSDAQLCLTLWDPLDCSPSGSSVHGVLLARILEWVAISFSRGSSAVGIEPVSSALQVDFILLRNLGHPCQVHICIQEKYGEEPNAVYKLILYQSAWGNQLMFLYLLLVYIILPKCSNFGAFWETILRAWNKWSASVKIYSDIFFKSQNM